MIDLQLGAPTSDGCSEISRELTLAEEQSYNQFKITPPYILYKPTYWMLG